MKTASLRELPIGPLALLRVVIVFVSAVLEVPQAADAARPAIDRRASR